MAHGYQLMTELNERHHVPKGIHFWKSFEGGSFLLTQLLYFCPPKMREEGRGASKTVLEMGDISEGLVKEDDQFFQDFLTTPRNSLIPRRSISMDIK